MEFLIPLVIVLAVTALLLARAHDSSLARKIGSEVRRQASAEDPVVLLEKLHGLREAGALTEAEYEAEKARILNQ
jgi:hypothetical protein